MAGTPQTRRQSLLEVLVSTALGLSISTATNFYALPLFGFEVSMHQAGAMAVLFTALSLIRSYIVRRLFNRSWSRKPAREGSDQPPPLEQRQAQRHDHDQS
jgi:uncharacterized membrane protein